MHIIIKISAANQQPIKDCNIQFNIHGEPKCEFFLWKFVVNSNENTNRIPLIALEIRGNWKPAPAIPFSVYTFKFQNLKHETQNFLASCFMVRRDTLAMLLIDNGIWYCTGIPLVSHSNDSRHQFHAAFWLFAAPPSCGTSSSICVHRGWCSWIALKHMNGTEFSVPWSGAVPRRRQRVWHGGVESHFKLTQWKTPALHAMLTLTTFYINRHAKNRRTPNSLRPTGPYFLFGSTQVEGTPSLASGWSIEYLQ